jgi:predicted ATPase
MFEVVGREDELASIGGFLGEVDPESSALVLEGEPGIGKSTLWLAGVEQAHTLGFRVLTSQPAEAERGLAYSGLGDLFEHVAGEVLPALAAPRRRALEVALLIEEPTDDATDPRALGIATRGALESLAESAPVLVAIDDLQWFDQASAGALAFAWRRLARRPPAIARRRALRALASPAVLMRQGTLRGRAGRAGSAPARLPRAFRRSP